MPKYYCDYCDTFLTHDSPSVRKTHNGGRKHKENVRMYYQAWMEEQAQKLVDATARAFTQQRLLNAGMGGPGMPGMMAPRAMIPPPVMRPTMPFPYPMPNMMMPQMPGMPPASGMMPRMPAAAPPIPRATSE